LSEGIEFSVAVIVREVDGKLVAEVPPQVSERLGVGAEDVLCWTGFFEGQVEAWSVKKSPYASLDDGSPAPEAK
jgi:hypothetical protein